MQPGTLSRLLTPEYFEAGLAARLLLAAPPNKLKRWTDMVPDQAALDTFDSMVVTLLRLEHNAEGGSVALAMTKTARAKYVAFYNAFAVEQFEADDDATAASAAKIEGCVPRLALIFALADDPYGSKVGGDSMRSAITVGRWFARESQRVYGMLRENPEERRDRELVEWIQKRGGSATARELRQGVRRYRDNPDAAGADLEQLVRAGRGRWNYGGGGKPGAPSKRFRLLDGPSLIGDNAPETRPGAIENGGSVGVNAVGAAGGGNDGGSPPTDPWRAWSES